MRKLLLSILVLFSFSSCITTNLYYWGGTQNQATTYENLAYMDYKKQSPQAICKLIVAYNDMVSNPTKSGIRKVPAPGICAEYGYMLLLPETATTFAENASAFQKRTFNVSNYESYFPELGKEMLKKEMEYYPESTPFIEPLLNKLAN